MESKFNPPTRLLDLKKNMKTLIEREVYDNKSMPVLEIPDQRENWWIFNFKGFFFDKKVARDIAHLFWDEMGPMLDLKKPIAIGGMESGAIPLVSVLCLYPPEGLTLSGFFVRKSRKKSDLANTIEGHIPQDSQIVIVDDILNRGSSFQKIQKVLMSYDKKVHGYFSIMRYRDKSFYEDKAIDIPIVSLYELNDFQESLGLKNLESIPFQPSFTYENTWAVQLCKPGPYHVVPKSAPLLNKGLIYQGADDGTFFAIDAESGKTVWSKKLAFGAEGKRIFSSPALYKGLVIFGGYDGNLYALDALTGKKEWIFFDADAIGSSPVVADDLGMAYIGLEFGLFRKKGGLAAIDLQTGKSIWTYYEMEGLTHASPVYSKKLRVVVCGCNNGKIYCFEAKSGKLRWCIQTEGEVKYGAVFDEKKQLVYIASMDGSVYCIAVKTGRVSRKFSALAGIYSTPVLYKDTLIVGSLDRVIYCWDINTGQKLWSLETSGRIFATGLIYEDRLYIGSNDGWLRVIDPASGKLLGNLLFAERIVNKVQIQDGVVYVPTQTCQLLAFKEIPKLH